MLCIFLIATVLVKQFDWLQSKDNKWSEQDLTTLSLTDFVIAADGE